jgi:hypothetical protein
MVKWENTWKEGDTTPSFHGRIGQSSQLATLLWLRSMALFLGIGNANGQMENPDGLALLLSYHQLQKRNGHHL